LEDNDCQMKSCSIPKIYQSNDYKEEGYKNRLIASTCYFIGLKIGTRVESINMVQDWVESLVVNTNFTPNDIPCERLYLEQK
jgi:hypothetical protein